MSQQSRDLEENAYVFGPFRLIPRRQTLLRGGSPVRIGGRALDILTLLVSRKGDIVSKRELLDFAWPGTFVHEANLKVNIVALRRALSADPDDYIATVAGRGYRFIANVATERDNRSTIVRSEGRRSRPLPRLPDLIGRDGEVLKIREALSAARNVTIVGPGGVGKTSVALAVAHAESAAFPDGVFHIDLSTVGDTQYALAAIASGVAARPGSEDTISEIVSALCDRQNLVILDNCEHLSPTISSIVSRLLDALPATKFLATSREPLWVVPELVYRLPSLELPPEGDIVTAREAMAFGAVQLFVSRAYNRGGYELTDADAPLVAATCRRLDGIALAIELAASKANAIGVAELLATLEQRFLLLSNGDRFAPLRQQTMMAALDWSYRLLSDEEAALLRLLSVFAGRFTLHDAVAMSEASGFDPTRTVDILERLTQKSVVHSKYQDGILRYRLLESTRSYVRERLSDSFERLMALERHARHILAMFVRASEQQAWRDKSEWMLEYASRIDDLRNALAWAFQSGDKLLGVQLTVAAIPLWTELSSLGEMQARIERALLAVDELGLACPAELTMRLIAARASGMSYSQHMAPATEDAWRDCYRLGLETGSAEYQLLGLWGLAAYLIYAGRSLESVDILHEFLATAESQSDWNAAAEGNRMLAMAEIYIGQIASARQRLEKLVARHRHPKDPVRFARFESERGVAIRSSYAFVLWISGEPERALQVARSAIERAEITGHVVSQSNTLAVVAIPIAIWSGNLLAADEMVSKLEDNGRQENIAIWREVCRFYRTAIRAKRREPGAADELRQRLADLAEVRKLHREAMLYVMVADAYLTADLIDEANQFVEMARLTTRTQTADWCLPEICRLEAAIAHGRGDQTLAERLLWDAIDKSEEIGALTLEVRATLDLRHLLESQGRTSEAAQLLHDLRIKAQPESPLCDAESPRATMACVESDLLGRLIA